MAAEPEVESSTIDPFVTIPKVYSNTIKVNFTLFEFQMIVASATINSVAEPAYQIVEPKFILQMSPQHFKVLSEVLARQLEKYEKQFGVISIPEEKKTQQ